MLGLAALAVHLSEAGPALLDVCTGPPAPARRLSIPDFLSSLLTCRTKESTLFCLRWVRPPPWLLVPTLCPQIVTLYYFAVYPPRISFVCVWVCFFVYENEIVLTR